MTQVDGLNAIRSGRDEIEWQTAQGREPLDAPARFGRHRGVLGDTHRRLSSARQMHVDPLQARVSLEPQR